MSLMGYSSALAPALPPLFPLYRRDLSQFNALLGPSWFPAGMPRPRFPGPELLGAQSPLQVALALSGPENPPGRLQDAQLFQWLGVLQPSTRRLPPGQLTVATWTEGWRSGAAEAPSPTAWVTGRDPMAWPEAAPLPRASLEAVLCQFPRSASGVRGPAQRVAHRSLPH